MLVSGSACRRCRRCPRRTEFVSRRDLRYFLRQARFGHNLANALDEGCGTKRLLPQDHLNSGIQPRVILDRKVAPTPHSGAPKARGLAAKARTERSSNVAAMGVVFGHCPRDQVPAAYSPCALANSSRAS